MVSTLFIQSMQTAPSMSTVTWRQTEEGGQYSIHPIDANKYDQFSVADEDSDYTGPSLCRGTSLPVQQEVH